MKILIVDDNLIFLKQLQKYLKANNFDVDIADGGKKAIEMLASNKYSAVVLDLKMPDMSGMEVLKWAYKGQINSKFIVVTGYGEVESAVEAMKLGAVDYIQKPFDTERLLTLLNKIKDKKIEVKHPSSKSLLDYAFNGIVLLIADINPAEFKRRYGVSAEESIWLRKNVKNSSHLSDLIEKIKKFAENKKGKATIIHSGIEYLLNTCGQREVIKYFKELHKMATTKHFNLVIVCSSSEEKMLLNEICESDIASYIEEVAEICKNPIRRKILQLLYNNSLNYTGMLKKLNIEYSSKLAFHLNKLIKKGIIEKNNRLYSLTSKGINLVEMLEFLLSFKETIKIVNIN
ncbi:MAG TPA: response regulator [Thermoplasmata archaeon]|nr:response regulator [Thermoplasmata archaeon]